MDCNIQCCTLVIFVAIAATFAYPYERLCIFGLRTAGFTEPSGDILLEYGQPLEINCTVYPITNYTSSSLTFFGLGKEIRSEYLSIVNKTTLRLYIDRPEIQSATYTCKLKTENNNASGVCLNRVTVGLRPQPVKDFTCISRNWNNLKCSWTTPQNNVRTTYSLSFSLHPSKIHYSCPNNTETSLSSCYWDLSTTPTYRQFYDNYKFTLNATNALGRASWQFRISNYASIIPDKPWNLTVVSTTVNSITLTWNIPQNLRLLSPGFIHKVEYKNEYHENWQDVDTSSLCVVKCTKNNPHYRLELLDLRFAHSQYDIRVRSRSAKENGTRWSEAAYVSTYTQQTIPGGPPRTNIGSFEISSTNSRSFRDVYLYWQEIPKYLENGDSFEYKVVSVEEDGHEIDIIPFEMGSLYACFHNLSSSRYVFKVASKNSMGFCKESSVITVPASKDIPPVPEQVTQIPFNSGTFQLSWKEPKHNSKIDNYTIFWCKNKSDRPCSVDLNWIVVESGVNSKNISGLIDSQVYQFGISTNSRGQSSGIIWASCTVLPGRGGGMMKGVSVGHTGSTYISLSWKPDCSNQIGIVSGFHIEYCELEHNDSCDPHQCPPTEECPNPLGIDLGDDKTFYNITGLKPFTWYLVYISVKFDKAKGARSDAIYAKTKEGVPDTIEIIKAYDITNTSAMLKWYQPENSNGELLHYTIYWGGEPRIAGQKENNGYLLNGLDSYEEYNVSVSGCTSVGCGVPSPVEKIRTRIGRPRAPSLIQQSYINSSKVTSWHAPRGSASNFTYYTLKFQFLVDGKVKFNDTLDNINTTRTVLPWDKCQGGGLATFNLSIRAVNNLEDGNLAFGPWSKPEEGPCFISSSHPITPPHLTVIIPLVAILLCIVLCIFCALFSQHLWVKFNRMRDISVKLPARLDTRQEDKSDNLAIHTWNNHIVRDAESTTYTPSPDEQSLLKKKEEIELIQEDTNVDRDSFGDLIQNNLNHDGNTLLVAETEADSTPAAPSQGYIKLAPPPVRGDGIAPQPSSGYVTFPPLAKGYIMAAVPPSPNVSPSRPQCSFPNHKQNSHNSFSPKPFNSFPEANHFGDNNMISPINST